MESWFIVISICVLAVIWFRTARGQGDSAEQRSRAESVLPDPPLDRVPSPPTVAPASTDSFLESLGSSLHSAEAAGRQVAEARAKAVALAARVDARAQCELPANAVMKMGLGDDLLEVDRLVRHLPHWIASSRYGSEINPLDFTDIVGRFSSDPLFDKQQSEDGAAAWPFPTGGMTDTSLAGSASEPARPAQTWADVRDHRIGDLKFSGEDEFDWGVVEFKWRGTAFGLLFGPLGTWSGDGALTVRCLYEEGEPRLAISVETSYRQGETEGYEVETVHEVMKVRRDGDWPNLLTAIRAYRAAQQTIALESTIDRDLQPLHFDGQSADDTQDPSVPIPRSLNPAADWPTPIGKNNPNKGRE